MPTVKTEGRYATEGLLSEAERGRSRDNIVIASGSGVIVPGQILGKVTASGKFKKSTATGSTGEEKGVAIALYGCDATTADQKISAITRAAQWRVDDLVFDATVNDATKKAAKIAELAVVGIIAR